MNQWNRVRLALLIALMTFLGILSQRTDFDENNANRQTSSISTPQKKPLDSIKN